jgi:transposase
MATPVKVRRLSDEEGRQLQRIVRRGGGKTDKSIVKWRRALVVLSSAGGNDVAVIARLVQTSPDRVREMIHSFNEKGMRALDPQWAGGRPRRITTEQRNCIITTAKKRPTSLGMPFSKWSIRKLAQYLATKSGGQIVVSRERLRQILAEEGVTFQRTKTWKESPDPRREEKLARIEWLLENERDRTFAFDEFGPLAIKPEGGSCWAQRSRPQRLRANYHKPHGTRQLFAWYSIGSDRLYGRIEPIKGAVPTLRAVKAIRALAPDGEQIYVILDNLNHHKGKALRQWCEEHAVELAFTPTYGSWANPIEAHFGPLRQFTIANSDYQSHTELASGLRKYIRWRNANTQDPDVLALERKHRAMLRGEAQRRWGQPRARAA